MQHRKLISLSIVMVLIALIPLIGLADEVTTRAKLMTKFSAVLRITNAKAKCIGMVSPKKITHSCSLTIKLQKKVDNRWKTLASWSENGGDGEIVTISETRSVASGYPYRVKATAYLKDSSGTLIESETITSSTVDYGVN